jgi:hypothetical protein
MSYSRAEVLKHMAQELGVTPKELSEVIKAEGWSVDRLKLEIAQHRAEMELADVPKRKTDQRQQATIDAENQRADLLGGVDEARFPPCFTLPDGRMFTRPLIRKGSCLTATSETRAIRSFLAARYNEVALSGGVLVVVSEADHSDELNIYNRDPAARPFETEADMLTWAIEMEKVVP